MPQVENFIKPSYRFTEVNRLMRELSLDMKIYDSFTDEGTNARLIERFGDARRLLDMRPCAFDDYGELVELDGTGIDSEYDAEIFLDTDGQITLI